MTDNPDPYDEKDEETGQFTRRFPDADFLGALADEPFAGTSDVASTVGCARETAYKTLQRLHEDGVVDKREVGASVAWSLADDIPPEWQAEAAVIQTDVAAIGGDSDTDSANTPDGDPDTTTGGSGREGGPHPASEPDRDRDPAADLLEGASSGGAPTEAGDDADTDASDGWPPDSDLDPQIEALELTGSADSEEGQAAIRALYDYVREQGTAQKQDFFDDVYPDHSVGLAEASWWNYVGKDTKRYGEGFKTIADRREDLRPPKGGNHRDYEYIGDESNSEVTEATKE